MTLSFVTEVNSRLNLRFLMGLGFKCESKMASDMSTAYTLR